MTDTIDSLRGARAAFSDFSTLREEPMGGDRYWASPEILAIAGALEGHPVAVCGPYPRYAVLFYAIQPSVYRQIRAALGLEP